VGGEFAAPYVRFVSLPGMEFLAGSHVPQLDSRVVSPADTGEDLAVWREAQIAHELHVKLTRHAQVGQAAHPDDGLVLLSFERDEGLAVGHEEGCPDPFLAFVEQVADFSARGGVPNAIAIPLAVRAEMLAV